jgi:hypothetical protein
MNEHVDKNAEGFEGGHAVSGFGDRNLKEEKMPEFLEATKLVNNSGHMVRKRSR